MSAHNYEELQNKPCRALPGTGKTARYLQKSSQRDLDISDLSLLNNLQAETGRAFSCSASAAGQSHAASLQATLTKPELSRFAIRKFGPEASVEGGTGGEGGGFVNILSLPRSQAGR